MARKARAKTRYGETEEDYSEFLYRLAKLMGCRPGEVRKEDGQLVLECVRFGPAYPKSIKVYREERRRGEKVGIRMRRHMAGQIMSSYCWEIGGKLDCVRMPPLREIIVDARTGQRGASAYLSPGYTSTTVWLFPNEESLIFRIDPERKSLKIEVVS